MFVFVVLLGVGMLKGYLNVILLKMIVGNMLGGWVVVLLILVFMLVVLMVFFSFGVFLIVNVILILLNLFVVNFE